MGSIYRKGELLWSYPANSSATFVFTPMRVLVKVKIYFGHPPGDGLRSSFLTLDTWEEVYIQPGPSFLSGPAFVRSFVMLVSPWTLPLAIILIFGLAFGIFWLVQPRRS